MSGKLFLRIFLSNCSEFCRSSTVHGLSHLVKHGRLERMFWAASMCCTVLLGTELIYKSYMRYETNPVVVSIDKNYFMWNVTFPSATWCVADKLDQKKAANVIARYWNVSEGKEYDRAMDFLRAVSNISYRSLEKFKEFLDDQKFKGLDFQYLMKAVNFVPPRNSFVSYTGNKFPSYEILTEEGICFSTSLNAASVSTSDDLRMLSNSPEVCSYFQLPCFARLMSVPRPLKYYVHSAYEIPDTKSKYWLVNEYLGEETYFSFLYTMAHSSLKDLRLQQRKCSLLEEVSHSSGSHFYSYWLCRMNCRRKLSMDLCKCVPHFYTKQDDEPFCDIKGLVCLSQYSNYLIDLTNENGIDKYPCQCYPSCSSVEYFLERITFVSRKEIEFTGMRFSWTIENFPKIAVKRHVIFGFEGLLVNLGGIAGFFIGASIASGIEILYFFVIKLLRQYIRVSMNKGKKVQVNPVVYGGNRFRSSLFTTSSSKNLNLRI